jgi:hypothetical protein
VAAIASGADAAHQIAAGAAAAAAAGWGAYDLPGGNDDANLAAEAGEDAEAMRLNAHNNASQNARAGAELGRAKIAGIPTNPKLIVTSVSIGRAGTQAGLGATSVGGTAAARAAAARPFVYNAIIGAVNYPIETEGMYHSTNVIDIGPSAHIADNYVATINGRVKMWDDRVVDPPGLDRQRTSLAPASLGNEVLWNTGPYAMAAPANAPAAFVVASRKYVWNAPPGSCPIVAPQPDNADSIGLVIRFGNFFFYTGGDLPSQGEDLVANAVMANGFANPQGGAAFAVPARIAAFKCGHHGAGHSTSAAFLAAIQPRAAFISCGQNQFGTGENHPSQNVVNRMQATAGMFFYLTNCNYQTNHIPASQAVEQLTVVGNRSRVCGDNALPNLGGGARHRGDIRLFLNQAEATAAVGAPARQFRVRYWENDDVPGGPPGALIGFRTENRQF